MDKKYELEYHSAEEANWWFVARRDLLRLQLKKLNIPKTAKILDIGCAGGVFLCELMQEGYTALYALDYSAEAIALCKERGLENAYQMDGHKPDFEENFFDVIIASDCLEHLSDDQMALNNWNKVLKIGGKALVYVPAYQFFWSDFDVTNHHFRRYVCSELKIKMQNSHFKIIQSGYWNIAVFLPTAIVRLGSKIIKGNRKKEAEHYQSDIVKMPTLLNKLLIYWMKIENRLSRYIRYPFGVSTFVVGEK